MQSTTADIEVEYLHIATGVSVLRANFPDEPRVVFHIETVESIRRKLDQQDWYATPNVIIVPTPENAVTKKAIIDSLEIERTYRYRPWRSPDVAGSVEPSADYRLEYCGDPASCQKTGWIDVVVHLGNRTAFTLTVETLISIERELMEGATMGNAWFYCPDLVVVQFIQHEVIEKAVVALIADGISRYGILADMDS
ncbi:hypothetical protein ACMHYB_53540 [Sorangium sp. So ce1128]